MRKIDRTGEVHISSRGEKITIIESFGSFNLTIKFEDGTIVEKIKYHTILSGEVKNKNYPATLGIGFTGYGKYDSVKYKFARQKWDDMLNRCYGDRESNPSYEGCTVHKDWHNFQNFAAWFESNYPLDCREKLVLDKDILVPGNKIYSEKTCCLIPQLINYQFKETKRGDLPIGIGKKHNMYFARLNRYGIKYTLASSHSLEEVVEIRRQAKQKYIKELAERFKPILSKEVYIKLSNFKS